MTIFYHKYDLPDQVKLNNKLLSIDTNVELGADTISKIIVEVKK